MFDERHKTKCKQKKKKRYQWYVHCLYLLTLGQEGSNESSTRSMLNSAIMRL